MMRALTFSLTLLIAGLLTGCGFTPMHGSSADGSRLTDISVELQKGDKVVDNQAGFHLTQRLRDRIGVAPETSTYFIEVTPRYRRTRLGITDGDVASRYDVTVQARWKLIDRKTGKTVDRGTAASIATFGAPVGPYGVITADNVGVEQASKAAADKLIVQLAGHFAEVSKKTKK